MPVCRKCSKTFPNRVEINGQRHVISNRKFCLECSPFGGHNTHKELSVTSVRCRCDQCGREYDYIPHRAMTKTRCNSCLSGNKRAKLKEQAVAFMGGKCQICGYNRCMRNFAFHHINSRDKSFQITGAWSWRKIEEELKKCILVCHNCHGEIHEGLIHLSDYVK